MLDENTVINLTMKPGTPPLQSTRLLDQVRERIRYLHYSLSTETLHVYWVRFFIRWHGVRHPRDMGPPEVEAFLSMLANERRVSASTHNQALRALLFLYREVLGVQLPWLDSIQRPSAPKRIPSVLTREEVASLLAALPPDELATLVARLLYGTGMRLMEGLRLRVKDLDFDRHVIIVRQAKGNKDRVVMLPRSLVPALRAQVLAARGSTTATPNAAALRCRMRWSPSTPGSANVGDGSGSFLPQACQLILEAVSSAAITFMKSDCRGLSRRRWHLRVFTSRCRSTPCATPSPPTCCRLAPTSAPCKSCSGIRMSAPP